MTNNEARQTIAQMLKDWGPDETSKAHESLDRVERAIDADDYETANFEMALAIIDYTQITNANQYAYAAARQTKLSERLNDLYQR